MDRHQLLQQEMALDQSMPVMPPDISCLLKTLNDDDLGYTELSNELEKFPSIVIKIVATANSAWAAPVNPITTLRDSCARIGVQAVRSVSIALSIAEVFDPAQCPLFDSKTFWVSALLTAEAAHICAKKDPDICANTARLAGLLHNMGLIWLASQKPLQTANAIALKQKDEVASISEGLSEQLGIDLYTSGAYLASYIDLPEAIANAIGSPVINSTDENPLNNNHRKAQKLAAAVLLASNPDTSTNTNTNENADSNEDSEKEQAMRDDPNFTQLSEKLTGIQSLAQALFFY